MSKHLSLWSILMGAVLFALPASALPRITSPVTDTARVLQPNEVERIAARIRDHQARTGNQIALLVVPNLEGLPIEDYSLQVARTWGGGERRLNNGILVVFAIDERRNRIDVGPGLQDRVTDGVAVSILHSVRPQLRAWRYGDAFYSTVDALVMRTGGTTSPAARAQAPREEDNTGLIILLIFGGVLLIALIIYLMRRSDRGSYGYGGGYSSNNTFIYIDSGSSSSGSSGSFWSSSSGSSGGSSNSGGWDGGGGGFDGGGGSDSW